MQPSVVDVVDAQSTEIDGTLLKWIVAKILLLDWKYLIPDATPIGLGIR